MAMFTLFEIALIITMFCTLFNNNNHLIDGLVVTETRFLSQGGKNWVLTDEPFSISCHFLLQKENEKVSSIEILKDDRQVYFYDLTTTSKPVISGVLKNAVNISNSSASFVYVQKATIEMHGNYTCKIKSEISCNELSAKLIVINDACKDTDWSMHVNAIHCLEVINFECIGMFPKPVPTCGVYEQNSGRLLSAELLLVQELPNGTYMLSKSHKYSAEEYRNKQGQFFYKCELTVPGTTWKRSINSRLFSRPSCPKPPEVDGGKYLLSPVKTCWNTPVEGALLTYECDKNHTLSKDGSLVCFEGAWRRFKGHIASFRDVNLNTMEFLSPEDDPFPYCNICSNPSVNPTLLVVYLIISHLYHLLT